MKTQIILLASLILLTGSSFASANAFDTVRPLVPTEVLRQQPQGLSTRDLQKDVLLKVNASLTHGLISPAEATELKSQLDSLGETESWYQTLDKPVPPEVFEQHKLALNGMSLKLDQAPGVTPVMSKGDALHSDVDELIGKALSGNKITSNQAEGYYSRLAEIESGLQLPRDTSARSKSETAALTKELQNLKATLSH